MKRIVGLGGVFFKSKDPKALAEWYAKHLGFPAEAWGGAIFQWADLPSINKDAYNIVSFFKETTTYLEPSTKEFMLNFVVEDLDGLLEVLKQEGVTVMPEKQDSEYGKFGWIMDPDGNKLELWEPAKKA